MDTRIRRNERCIIGLPRCDYVFSSTRSCFIGYGFATSALETSILRRVLEEHGIEPVEAGGTRAPGANAFCVKICSKIITSQFCVILINNDIAEGQEVPNANVNMEYGLMLGFNKYVIPFQREGQALPFNVAGLDTIKYTNENFEVLATDAVAEALEATVPEEMGPTGFDQRLHVFLLSQNLILASVESEGDRSIFDLGSHLGFNLLTDLSGTHYTFFGRFTHLRPEAVLWRARMLKRAIDGRRSSWPKRVKLGILTEEQAEAAEEIFSEFGISLLVNSIREKEAVGGSLGKAPLEYRSQVLSLDDVETALDELDEEWG